MQLSEKQGLWEEFYQGSEYFFRERFSVVYYPKLYVMGRNFYELRV